MSGVFVAFQHSQGEPGILQQRIQIGRRARGDKVVGGLEDDRPQTRRSQMRSETAQDLGLRPQQPGQFLVGAGAKPRSMISAAENAATWKR